MTLIERIRKQTAIYWPMTSDEYDSYGKPIDATPVEISCRWQEVNEEFIDAQGDRKISSAKIFVGQNMTPGEYLKLGDIGDVESGKTASEHDGAYEIKKVEKIPNFKVTEFLIVCYL